MVKITSNSYSFLKKEKITNCFYYNTYYLFSSIEQCKDYWEAVIFSAVTEKRKSKGRSSVFFFWTSMGALPVDKMVNLSIVFLSGQIGEVEVEWIKERIGRTGFIN